MEFTGIFIPVKYLDATWKWRFMKVADADK